MVQPTATLLQMRGGAEDIVLLQGGRKSIAEAARRAGHVSRSLPFWQFIKVLQEACSVCGCEVEGEAGVGEDS